MAAAYADFAKAYQSMFEMEFGLSEATPEGYMSALLEMARAFARAGDAQHAQDAYNAVRKRHSREEVEQIFRKLERAGTLKKTGAERERGGGRQRRGRLVRRRRSSSDVKADGFYGALRFPRSDASAGAFKRVNSIGDGIHSFKQRNARVSACRLRVVMGGCVMRRGVLV